MIRYSRAAAMVVASLALTGLSGCAAMTNPPLTQQEYMPSDGVEARLPADVKLAQALFLAADAESPGTLIARVVNTGSESQRVAMASPEVGLQLVFSVEPGQTYEIGPEGDDEALIDEMGVIPGKRVAVQVGLVEGQEPVEPQLISVPVLDDTLEEYADLVPEPDATATR